MVRQEDSPYVEGKEADRRSVEVRTAGTVNSPENHDASFKRQVNAAVLVILMILVFIAMLSFFFNMLAAIAALIHPKYQALIQAFFSLLVLVIGIYVIRLLLKNKR